MTSISRSITNFDIRAENPNISVSIHIVLEDTTTENAFTAKNLRASPTILLPVSNRLNVHTLFIAKLLSIPAVYPAHCAAYAGHEVKLTIAVKTAISIIVFTIPTVLNLSM